MRRPFICRRGIFINQPVVLFKLFLKSFSCNDARKQKIMMCITLARQAILAGGGGKAGRRFSGTF
jgi:hypothetical protein